MSTLIDIICFGGLGTLLWYLWFGKEMRKEK